MTELRQYDPLQVVGSWTTPIGVFDVLDGVIGSGDFVTPTKDNPRWSREFDRASNSTRVKNNNKGGAVSIVFSASSPTNHALSLAAETDDLGENVVGVLLLRDLNGNTVIEADGAFIEDIPPPTFGSERGSRTWTWQCAALRTHVGGHDLA